MSNKLIPVGPIKVIEQELNVQSEPVEEPGGWISNVVKSVSGSVKIEIEFTTNGDCSFLFNTEGRGHKGAPFDEVKVIEYLNETYFSKPWTSQQNTKK